MGSWRRLGWREVLHQPNCLRDPRGIAPRALSFGHWHENQEPLLRLQLDFDSLRDLVGLLPAQEVNRGPAAPLDGQRLGVRSLAVIQPFAKFPRAAVVLLHAVGELLRFVYGIGRDEQHRRALRLYGVQHQVHDPGAVEAFPRPAVPPLQQYGEAPASAGYAATKTNLRAHQRVLARLQQHRGAERELVGHSFFAHARRHLYVYLLGVHCTGVQRRRRRRRRRAR
mmetsp:Transcript_13719/g.40547  ORF Transcript_13719/g.40547 Transcript_13719/m.40547 type:complete len:225 (-) Transcript_13719:146-820(-)